MSRLSSSLASQVAPRLHIASPIGLPAVWRPFPSFLPSSHILLNRIERHNCSSRRGERGGVSRSSFSFHIKGSFPTVPSSSALSAPLRSLTRPLYIGSADRIALAHSFVISQVENRGEKFSARPPKHRTRSSVTESLHHPIPCIRWCVKTAHGERRIEWPHDGPSAADSALRT